MKAWIPIITAALGLAANAAASAADESAAPAVATPSSASPATPGPRSDVVISGHRAELEPRIRTFVNQLTSFNINDPEQGMARWSEISVCPLVSGLTKNDAEFILGRVSEIARNAGVPLGKERCRANLYVLITTDPKAVLRGMQNRNAEFTFGEAIPRVVDEFIDTPRAVRVAATAGSPRTVSPTSTTPAISTPCWRARAAVPRPRLPDPTRTMRPAAKAR